MNFQLSVAQNVYELNADINVKLTFKYTTQDLFFPTIESPLPVYFCRKWIEIDTKT